MIRFTALLCIASNLASLIAASNSTASFSQPTFHQDGNKPGLIIKITPTENGNIVLQELKSSGGASRWADVTPQKAIQPPASGGEVGVTAFPPNPNGTYRVNYMAAGGSNTPSAPFQWNPSERVVLPASVPEKTANPNTAAQKKGGDKKDDKKGKKDKKDKDSSSDSDSNGAGSLSVSLLTVVCAIFLAASM